MKKDNETLASSDPRAYSYKTSSAELNLESINHLGDDQEEAPKNNNPAIDGYYKSLSRKNNAFAFATWIALFLFTCFLGIVGYYLANIREPITILNTEFSDIKDRITNLENFNDEVKKYMYSNPKPINTLTPSPTPIH